MKLLGGLSAQGLLDLASGATADRFLVGDDFPLANHTGVKRTSIGLFVIPGVLSTVAEAVGKIQRDNFSPVSPPWALAWLGSPDVQKEIRRLQRDGELPNPLTILALEEEFRNRQGATGYLSIQIQAEPEGKFGANISSMPSTAISHLTQPLFSVVSVLPSGSDF